MDELTDHPRLDPTLPAVGRAVLYQTDGRGGLRYALPATVVRTRRSTDPRAITDPGHEPEILELPDATTVDLFVQSLKGFAYGEDAVPYDPDGSPRSWRWYTDALAEDTAGPA